MCDARGCIGWGSVMFISGIFHDGLMPIFIWALLDRGSLLIAFDIRVGTFRGKMYGLVSRLIFVIVLSIKLN